MQVINLGVQGKDKTPTILRAAAYARVSTTQEIQEHSLETQEEYFRTMINANPLLTLVGIYGDQASGRDIHGRKEFTRMIGDCRNHKIDVIYTKSISRFGRNVADVLETLRELKTLGVRVVFEKEGLDTAGSQSELIFSILAVIAQEESRSISSNLKWARQENLKQGKVTTKTPYGYIKNAHYRWMVNPREARRVKKAFSMAIERHSYQEILAALQQMEDEECTGATWSQQRIRYLLQNILYTGDYVSDRIVTVIDPVKGKKQVKNTGQRGQFVLSGHHEPLVSKEDFEEVQRLIEEKALCSKHHYPAHNDEQ